MAPDVAETPLRLLVVSNMWPSEANPSFGVFVKRQVEALRSLGHEVEVVANDDPSPGLAASLRKYPELLARARAAGARGRGRTDLVVGHYLYPTAPIAAVAARRAGVPLVLVSHGTDVSSVQGASPVARACLRATRAADAVVCVSEALERRVRDELALPATTAIAVAHMGVDLDVFSPRPEARSALEWDTEERVALVVGNLLEVKGVDVALDAFARLAAVPHACDRLVIVGDGPQEAALRSRAGSLGVAERVTFAGRLTAGEVALRMAAADVLVLPSRSEGLGLVLLEAMACGTPCVASEVGGVPEVLRVPECGRLVPPDDPAALAEAVAEVIAAGRASYSDACETAAATQGTREQAERFVEAVRPLVCEEV